MNDKESFVLPMIMLKQMIWKVLGFIILWESSFHLTWIKETGGEKNDCLGTLKLSVNID